MVHRFIMDHGAWKMLRHFIWCSAMYLADLIHPRTFPSRVTWCWGWEDAIHCIIPSEPSAWCKQIRRLSERIKHAPIWGPPFRVTFCPIFPGGGKQWIHAGESVEIVGLPTRTGEFPVLGTPSGKGGQRRHKTVTTLWCMFDSPWVWVTSQYNLYSVLTTKWGWDPDCLVSGPISGIRP